MDDELSFNLNEVQKNADILDSEALHMYLIGKINSGESDSCLEALSEYVEEHDIDLDNPSTLKKYISPALYGVLKKEAMKKSMLVDKMSEVTMDDFF